MVLSLSLYIPNWQYPSVTYMLSFNNLCSELSGNWILNMIWTLKTETVQKNPVQKQPNLIKNYGYGKYISIFSQNEIVQVDHHKMNIIVMVCKYESFIFYLLFLSKQQLRSECRVLHNEDMFTSKHSPFTFRQPPTPTHFSADF